MCAKYGGSESTRDNNTALVAASFPLTMKVIDRKMAEKESEMK